MSDPTLSVTAPRTIPGQRSEPDHPMRPDLPPHVAGPGYGSGRRQDLPAPAATAVPFAHWGLRVAATVIDTALQIPFLVAQVIGLLIALDGGGITWEQRAGWFTWNDTFAVAPAQLTTATWIGLVIANLASIAGGIFSFRNNVLRQGRRGASIGKQCMNIVVVSETDGRPIGALMTIVRNLAHILDLVMLGVGYLWPLWDRKRQTFADMAMGTAVLHLPPEPPRPPAVIPVQATSRW